MTKHGAPLKRGLTYIIKAVKMSVNKLKLHRKFMYKKTPKTTRLRRLLISYIMTFILY